MASIKIDIMLTWVKEQPQSNGLMTSTEKKNNPEKGARVGYT